MAVNNIYSTSSLLRLSGLSSGLDTDSIVKQLMTAEKIPLNRLYQKKQLAEWKQDAYREVINKLRDLKDTYFNLAKPASNLTSKASFIKYAGTSSNSSYVTISGNSGAAAGSHTVSVISVATAGIAASAGGVTDDLTGNTISNFDLSGKKIKITLDGTTRELTLGDYSADPDSIGTQLQALVDAEFGSGKITVSYGGQKLTFASAGGAGRITLYGGSDNDGLADLGFTSGATNRLNINKSLQELSTSFKNDLVFDNGKLEFTINNRTFSFDSSVSIASMMNTINSDAAANVGMRYDETSDQFIITAKQLGAGNNISISTTQSGNFFGDNGASGIKTGAATTKAGTDASAVIDGVTVTRNSNTITLGDITYTLLKAHANPAADSETVSLSIDTDAVFNNIKGFADKYNELISFINTKLTEKYDRDYQPLTDEQKENMKDDEIKAWETKAKTGMLRNDPLLQNVVYNMRKALSDSISGISTSLSSIGITTGSYHENGKLIIDETKLKDAIQKDPGAVADLFAKASDVSYAASNTPELRTSRYNNEGLAYRISDILDDNIRTVNGKGLLLQMAGIEGDRTQYDNTIYKQISGYNDAIAEMAEKLTDKENAYYAKFTALEKYISQMNAQSNWLASQFGGSSN